MYLFMYFFFSLLLFISPDFSLQKTKNVFSIPFAFNALVCLSSYFCEIFFHDIFTKDIQFLFIGQTNYTRINIRYDAVDNE